jgi:hypothetical protein
MLNVSSHLDSNVLWINHEVDLEITIYVRTDTRTDTRTNANTDTS